MRAIARLLLVVCVAFVGVVPLAVSYTLATVVQLLATTALIMGGTGHPLVNPNGTPMDGSYPLSEPEYADAYVLALSENYIVPSEQDRGVAVVPDNPE